MTDRGGRHGLAARLFAAQVLVVVAGAVTLLVVALSTAPGLFSEHIRRAVGPVSPTLARHLDEAFTSAFLLAFVVGVVAALIVALAVSWFVTERISSPVRRLARAAERVAAGRFDVRVPISRLGAEFVALDRAFNEMACALETTETRRRELLADLAHELRTPIATIDAYVEALADGVVPTDADAWRTLQDQTTRLRRLVDDVGTVSEAEESRLALRREPLDAAELAVDAVRAARPMFARKGVALDCRGRPPAPIVGDPDRLREVVGNLLDNALRHTDAGGHVTVETTTGARLVEISVVDDGAGVPAEQLAHLFERFYRGDPARARASGGSGIGLTIVRALVLSHGGTVSAHSAGPGLGARFVVRLPRRTADPGRIP